MWLIGTASLPHAALAPQGHVDIHWSVWHLHTHMDVHFDGYMNDTPTSMTHPPW